MKKSAKTTYEVFKDSWKPNTPWRIRFITLDVEAEEGTQGKEFELPQYYRTKKAAEQDARAILGLESC